MHPLATIPLVASLRGKSRDALLADVIAGTTTAVMLVPQAMAYAMLAGLPPIIGLYASTVPLAIYALFGSSRQLAVGPVAMVSLMVASGIAALGASDPASVLAIAALLALLVGAIQLVMGVIRVGFLVKFLSHPVLLGFTAAAALIIGASQLKHVLGISLPRSHHVHATVIAAARQLGDVNLATLAIGAATITALVGLKRLAPRLPRFLIVVVFGTLAVWFFELAGAGVAIVGAVPSGLPTPALPSIGLDKVIALLPLAATIALVAFMESIAVAKAFARKDGAHLDADQELRALGLANLAAGLFRGYPITGGFSRTAVNVQAGARSQVASLVTAALVAASLLFLTPLFFHLPNAVLAAIILTAVGSLINISELRHVWRVSRADAAMAAIAFVATLTLGIELGILVGVGASLVWFVASSAKPHIAVLGRVPGSQTYRNIRRNPDVEVEDGILIVRIDAPLFFANTAFLKSSLAALESEQETPTRGLVIDASAIGSIDSAGADVVLEILADCRRRERPAALAAVRGPVRDRLAAADSEGLVGEALALDVASAVARVVGAVSTPRLTVETKPIEPLAVSVA